MCTFTWPVQHLCATGNIHENIDWCVTFTRSRTYPGALAASYFFSSGSFVFFALFSHHQMLSLRDLRLQMKKRGNGGFYITGLMRLHMGIWFARPNPFRTLDVHHFFGKLPPALMYAACWDEGRFPAPVASQTHAFALSSFAFKRRKSLEHKDKKQRSAGEPKAILLYPEMSIA